MHAEHGNESAELEPTGEQFLVLLFRRAVAEKSADVGIPIRDSADAEIQPGGDLLREDIPVSLDITGPGDCGVPLLTGVSGTGQDAHPFFFGLCALALIYSGGVVSWIDVVY